MRTYCLSHLPDATLLRDLVALVVQDRGTTAAMLAHLAEVDARRLYLPAAYPSMYAYCVGELRLSEDATWKRLQAARAARRFPALLPALADGRLHLAAVCLLAPHLTLGNADELIAAAVHKSKGEVEQLLAQRFPRTEVLPLVVGLPPLVPATSDQPAPGQVEVTIPKQTEPMEARSPGLMVRLAPAQADAPAAGQIRAANQPAPEWTQPAPGQVGPTAPERMEAPSPRPRMTPLAPQRFALQVTIGQQTLDKLRYAQQLLGHQLPSGEIAEVLDRALDALIAQLEKRKFAATSRPRRVARRTSQNPRHIPAEIKRAVWKRDRGQCTFVSQGGKRCPARTRLEFDHVEPVARGGLATIAGVRLRCRAHNQYDAEQVYGAGFIQQKREAAQRSRASRRARGDEVAPWTSSHALGAPVP
ncbi:MAG TPA: hypothetical protein VI792_12525 [Candidatus Eisenbacteria bacterium]